MVFSSIAEYDSFYVDTVFQAAKLNSFAFVSMKSTVEGYDEFGHPNAMYFDSAGTMPNPSLYLPDTVYDDYGLLAELLNPERIIKIDSLLIKVNIPEDQVLVIKDHEGIHYQDLVNNNTDVPGMMEFNTDDDVLTLIQGGFDGTPSPPENEPYIFGRIVDWGVKGWNRITSWGCDDRFARQKKNGDSDRGGRRDRWRLKFEVEYRSSGINFALVARARAQKRSAHIWWADKRAITVVGHYSYEGRCDKVTPVPLRSYTYTSSNTTNKLTHHIYRDSRALKSYYLSGQFTSHPNSSGVVKVED